jgi:hypothetical protein
VHPYGLGTAAVLATSSTWRWQTRTPLADRRHQLFWRQLLRQLAEEAQRRQAVSLRTRGESLQVSVAQRRVDFSAGAAASVRATVTAPDGAEAVLNLSSVNGSGAFTAQYESSGPGVHRVDVEFADGTTTTGFTRLGIRQPEFFSPVQNVGFLKRVAAATGGSYWTPATSDGISNNLTYSAAGVRERHALPLWDMPALFILLLLIKTAEWVLRRRWGRI